MKNFVKSGDVIEVIAPSGGTISGRLNLFGAALFGVETDTVAEGLKASLQVEGEISVAKLAANNMIVGVKVNFNDATKEVQLATSTLDGVGIVTVAAGAAITEVRIKLTP